VLGGVELPGTCHRAVAGEDQIQFDQLKRREFMQVC